MFGIRVLELITTNTPWLYNTMHAAMSQSAFKWTSHTYSVGIVSLENSFKLSLSCLEIRI